MILLDLSTFLGHLHPLIVHLPIGFIFLAFVLQLLSANKQFHNLRPAVSITLLLGFIAAVLACDFGYLLSLSGDYDADILTAHKTSGIMLAAISGLLCLVNTNYFRRFYRIPSSLYAGFLLGLVVLVAYSGHQGGSLTHGGDYLSMRVLKEQKRPKPLTIDEAYIFEDVVQPILNNKCLPCHRDGKLKGNLSVESLSLLKKGGKHGAAVVEGKAAESELLKRVTLAPEHKDFMPADGKTPLTKIETEIITWWISQANATEGKKLAQLKAKDQIAQQVGLYLQLIHDAENSAPVQQLNPDIPLNINKQLIENLRKKGMMVRVMLQKPAMLDVSLPAKSGIKAADFRKELLALAKHVIWLNLADNDLTAQDLDFLNELSNLEKLRLEKNPIDDLLADQVIYLKHLQALNLTQTRITAVGLAKMGQNSAIKRIYTWKSAVN